MEKFQERFERRFSQIINCLHQQTTSLSGKIDEHFYKLEQTPESIKRDVIRLKYGAEEDRKDVNELLREHPHPPDTPTGKGRRKG